MKDLEEQLKRIADLMEQILEQRCYPPYYYNPQFPDIPPSDGTFKQYCCDCRNPNTPPFVGDCLCSCHPKITSQNM